MTPIQVSRKEAATIEYFRALGKPKRCAAAVDNQGPGNHRDLCLHNQGKESARSL